MWMPGAVRALHSEVVAKGEPKPLRSKVEPNPKEPTYIKTVREIGYRFELPE